MTVTCPACSYDNATDAEFCDACGYELGAPTAPVSAPVSAPVWSTSAPTIAFPTEQTVIFSPDSNNSTGYCLLRYLHFLLYRHNSSYFHTFHWNCEADFQTI